MTPSILEPDRPQRPSELRAFVARRARACRCVIAIVALGATATAAAIEGDLARMAWLAGCWSADNAEPGSGEQWTAPAGATMLGVSRTVKQGKTVAYEFMQLRDLPDGTLAFIAQPSGNPPTPFALARMTETEAVFENTKHDFPQRVVYASEGRSKLRARIEGPRGGALRVIEFPMTRVGCDASATTPAK
jgi:hypothetical protein